VCVRTRARLRVSEEFASLGVADPLST